MFAQRTLVILPTYADVSSAGFSHLLEKAIECCRGFAAQTVVA